MSRYRLREASRLQAKRELFQSVEIFPLNHPGHSSSCHGSAAHVWGRLRAEWRRLGRRLRVVLE